MVFLSISDNFVTFTTYVSMIQNRNGHATSKPDYSELNTKKM